MALGKSNRPLFGSTHGAGRFDNQQVSLLKVGDRAHGSQDVGDIRLWFPEGGFDQDEVVGT